MLFASYGWGKVAPEDMCIDTFWAVHRLLYSVACLAFVKSVGYGRSLRDRLVIDFVLAFLWGNVIDRIMGITDVHWRDLIILPAWVLFTGVAAWKHRKSIVQ